MKTTIEISDALLERAKKLAAREQTTLKSLIERGLRQVIAEHKHAPPFRLRKAAFKGRGLSVEAERLGWDRLVELAYEGRGG